jgi:hypothetical protein
LTRNAAHSQVAASAFLATTMTPLAAWSSRWTSLRRIGFIDRHEGVSSLPQRGTRHMKPSGNGTAAALEREFFEES